MAAVRATASLCSPVQTVCCSADMPTGGILMSRQRDFTQQLVCGHTANLVSRLSADHRSAQFDRVQPNGAKINTHKQAKRSLEKSICH